MQTERFHQSPSFLRPISTIDMCRWPPSIWPRSQPHRPWRRPSTAAASDGNGATRRSGGRAGGSGGAGSCWPVERWGRRGRRAADERCAVTEPAAAATTSAWASWWGGGGSDGSRGAAAGAVWGCGARQRGDGAAADGRGGRDDAGVASVDLCRGRPLGEPARGAGLGREASVPSAGRRGAALLAAVWGTLVGDQGQGGSRSSRASADGWLIDESADGSVAQIPLGGSGSVGGCGCAGTAEQRSGVIVRWMPAVALQEAGAGGRGRFFHSHWVGPGGWALAVAGRGARRSSGSSRLEALGVTRGCRRAGTLSWAATAVGRPYRLRPLSQRPCHSPRRLTTRCWLASWPRSRRRCRRDVVCERTTESPFNSSTIL